MSRPDSYLKKISVSYSYFVHNSFKNLLQIQHDFFMISSYTVTINNRNERVVYKTLKRFFS